MQGVMSTNVHSELVDVTVEELVFDYKEKCYQVSLLCTTTRVTVLELSWYRSLQHNEKNQQLAHIMNIKSDPHVYIHRDQAQGPSTFKKYIDITHVVLHFTLKIFLTD